MRRGNSPAAQELGINVSDLARKFFRQMKIGIACRFLQSCDPQCSRSIRRSERKNGRSKTGSNWQTLLNAKVFFRTIIFVSGEADEKEMTRFRTLFKDEAQVRFAHGCLYRNWRPCSNNRLLLGTIPEFLISRPLAERVAFSYSVRPIPKFGRHKNTSASVLLAPNGDLTQIDLATVSKMIGL